MRNLCTGISLHGTSRTPHSCRQQLQLMQISGRLNLINVGLEPDSTRLCLTLLPHPQQVRSDLSTAAAITRHRERVREREGWGSPSQLKQKVKSWIMSSLLSLLTVERESREFRVSCIVCRDSCQSVCVRFIIHLINTYTPCCAPWVLNSR